VYNNLITFIASSLSFVFFRLKKIKSIYFDLLNPVGVTDMIFTFLATGETCG